LPGFRLRRTPRPSTPACPVPGQGSPHPGEEAPSHAGFSVFRRSRDMRATRPLLYPLAGTVQAFGRSSGLLCPLLTSAPRSADLAITPVPEDTVQISRGKPCSFPRTPAGFTAVLFDGYGLRGRLPARPATTASLSGCCSSGREFAPHFLQTVPRGSALVLHSCFTSIRLHRGLSPPSCRACPAHSPAPSAHRYAAGGLDHDALAERSASMPSTADSIPRSSTQFALLATVSVRSSPGFCISAGAIAVLVLDGAGWHRSPRLKVPDNIALLPLPPYSPELNPVENV
jgi:hypothetical protein